MNPEDVPADLVEKAARAQYENRVIELDQAGDTDWDGLPESWRDEWREGARHALAAVLPEVQAQALNKHLDRYKTTRDSMGDSHAAFGVLQGIADEAARLAATTEEKTT